VGTKRVGIAPSFAVGINSATQLTLSAFYQRQWDKPDYGVPWIDIGSPATDVSHPAPVPPSDFYGFRSDYSHVSVSMLTASLRSQLTDRSSLRNQIRYAVYNQNLDRAIQSFEVVYPLFPPFVLNNVGFHAPPQHPGFANDGTQGDAGYSSDPWIFTTSFTSATWNCQTFAENQNANAIRFGTLYNFRFDSTAPPAETTANIGFFKTGSPISVKVQAPAQSDATPTVTPSATPPTPTPTVTPTPTATPRATPRPRPTPHPRP